MHTEEPKIPKEKWWWGLSTKQPWALKSGSDDRDLNNATCVMPASPHVSNVALHQSPGIGETNVNVGDTPLHVRQLRVLWGRPDQRCAREEVLLPNNCSTQIVRQASVCTGLEGAASSRGTRTERFTRPIFRFTSSHIPLSVFL